MNQLILIVLAFTGGIFLAIQGGLNAQLGVLLRNPLLASLVAFSSSTFFAFCIVFFGIKDIPNIQQLKEIPYYLWFTGGLCSMIGIGLYYYTIPKLGISTMISLGLCGQLLFSATAGHFGWFNLPLEPIDYKKIVGIIAMVISILFINNS
ncbi:MAG: DMT family transporter [Bacteroidota bacterium]